MEATDLRLNSEWRDDESREDGVGERRRGDVGGASWGRRNAAYKPCRIHGIVVCLWLVYILLYKLISNYYAGMLIRIWLVINLQYECYRREYV